ncbi:hypothetical protein GCM10009416_00380 [Craurococcus roseus]|uniref:PepSY domain-containing protein n=1 Tax=Craurococcus roseus TaxID=77585 RepID=A0ABP3PM96_9PROT
MAPKLIAAAAAFGVALAGPAFAQGQQGQQQQSQSSGQQRQQGQSQQQAMGQERLRQQLTQAGFRDVQILDTAYLVQARTQDGNTVLMTINPPSAGSQTSGSSGTPGGGSSGGSGSGSGGSQQGSGSGRTQ